MNPQGRDSADDDSELDTHVSASDHHGNDTAGIRRRTEICQDLFEACQRFPTLLEADWIDKMSADFNWWSLGIGAGLSGHSSLDHRVQTRDDVRNVLVSLLDSLATSLRNCVEIATSHAAAEEAKPMRTEVIGDPIERPPNHLTNSLSLDEEGPDLDEQKYYITTTLKFLSKISAAIRKSGTKFRHQRIDNLLEERAPKLQKFRDYLRHIILMGPAQTHLLNWMLYHHTLTVDSMWKTMWITFKAYFTDVQRLNPVQERLIQANLVRRNRFDIYFRLAERKVQGEEGRVLSATNARIQTQPIIPNPTLDGRPTSTTSRDSKSMQQMRNVPLQKAATVDTSILSSQPATGIGSFVMPERPRTQGTRSVSTKFSQGVLKQDYPKCPIADGKTSWCPFCAQPLDSSYSDPKKNKKWRGHVAGDLSPYVCVYPDCDMPDVMYVTTDEWKKHLRDRHSAPRWICDPCWLESDNPIEYEFDLEEDWYEHTVTEHDGEFDEGDLPDLAKVSLRTVVPPVSCPLCYGDSPLLQPETDSHIVEHLHSFALQALPWKIIGRDDDTQASVGSDVMKATQLEDRDESEDEENWDEIYDLPRLIDAMMNHNRDLRGAGSIPTHRVQFAELQELLPTLTRLSERHMLYDSDVSQEIAACLAKLDRTFQRINTDNIHLTIPESLESLEIDIGEGLTFLNGLIKLGEQNLDERLASKNEEVDTSGELDIPEEESVAKAIQPLFQSFVAQASAKLSDSVTVPFEPEPHIEQICGPGVDPIFDQTIYDLGRIASPRPKMFIDVMMLWRKTNSDATHKARSELQLMLSKKSKGHSRQRKTASLPTSAEISSQEKYLAEKERQLTASVYILCRVLTEVVSQSDLASITPEVETKLEVVIFNQLKIADLMQLMGSPMKLANWNMFAKLLGQMSDINFSGVTGMFLKDLEGSFRKLAEPSISHLDRAYTEDMIEIVLGGMKDLQIKMSPDDNWEQSCDFLASLGRLIAGSHSDRVERACCQCMERFLLLIAATASNRHISHPKWDSVLNAIPSKITSTGVSQKLREAIFPLATALLCVSFPDDFKTQWLELLSSFLFDMKGSSISPVYLQAVSRLAWTYLYRIDDDFQTTISKFGTVIDLAFLSPKPPPWNPEITEPVIQAIRFLGFRYPEHCFRTIISPFIEEDLFTGGNDVDVEQLDPVRILIGIQAFLYVMSDLEKGKEGRPPFPQSYDAPLRGDAFRVLIRQSPQHSLTENIRRPFSTDALSDGVRECYLGFCKVLSGICILFGKTFDDRVIIRGDPNRSDVFNMLWDVIKEALPSSFSADIGADLQDPSHAGPSHGYSEYLSPMRQHKLTLGTRREVKETLDAHAEFLTEAGDEGTHLRINQYSIREEIGRGSLCCVYLAFDQFGNEFAVREISKSRLRRRTRSRTLWQGRQADRRVNPGLSLNTHLSHMEKEDPLFLIRKDVAILKKLNHPNVVQLVEVLDDPEEDSLYMVMEMCKRGAVMKINMDGEGEPIEEEQCRIWFRDFILAMEYLHAQGIIHRDLKPGNLLLSDDDVLKVDVFGGAEIVDNPKQVHVERSTGSPIFRPPELIVAHSDASNTAADIWSMGVCLYCLKYGRIPFKGDTILDILEAIKSDEPQFSDDENSDFVDLISQMLDKNPKTRINMDQLRKHSWVTYQGFDPLLSSEDNCASLVDPPNDLEVSHAFTRKVNHLHYVVKAISRFKAILVRNRSRGTVNLADLISIPPKNSLDLSEEFSNTETIEALLSQRRKFRRQDVIGGDAGKTVDHMVSQREAKFLGIGTGARDDFSMDQSSLEIVSDSPTAVDFNIYERAYENAVEEISLTQTTSQKPTVYLTRFVEGVQKLPEGAQNRT